MDERTFGKPEAVAANVEKLRAEEKSLTSIIETKKKELEQINARYEETVESFKSQRSADVAKHEKTIKFLKDEINQLTIIVDQELKNLDVVAFEHSKVVAEIKKEEAKKDVFVAEMMDIRQTVEKAKADIVAIQADQTSRESNLVKCEADFNVLVLAHTKEQTLSQERSLVLEKRENELNNEMQALNEESKSVDNKRAEIEMLHNAATIAKDENERKNAEADVKLENVTKKEKELNQLISESEKQSAKNNEERNGLVSWGEDLHAQEVDLKRRQRLSTLNDSP